MDILIVDDNPIITKNIAFYLDYNGYQCTEASDGEIAFELLLKKRFDCIILDRMMPNLDGIGLARLLKTRNINTPIIFLTALGKTIDKIEGLTLGADDYLVKPFDLKELSLRIGNIIERTASRTQGNKQILGKASILGELVYGNIRVDTKLLRVSVDNKNIDLSPKEYGMLVYFLRHTDTIITRDELYEAVWKEESTHLDSLDTINVHIAHLRKKLNCDYIQTIKYQGYVFTST